MARWSTNASEAQPNPPQLAFKESTAFDYDEDQYDFNILDAYANGALLATFSENVVAGTDYTFVITDAGGTVMPLVLEAPKVAANAADAQVAAVNAANGSPTMDVYLEPAGTDITGATPWGAVGFTQSLAPQTTTPGTYELTLTEAGNAANVLFTSTPFEVTAAKNLTLIVTAENGEGNSLYSVMFLQDTTLQLYDKNAPATLRVINTVSDQQPRDVYLDGQQVIAAAPYTGPSDYFPAHVGTDLTYQVTPAGSPGALELDTTVTTAGTRSYTDLVTGTPGALAHQLTQDDGRRLVDQGRIRFFNGALQFTALDYLVVPTGTEITADTVPVVTLLPTNGTIINNFAPGTYDLVVRENGTANVVAGPTSITLATDAIYGVLTVNGASSATADVILFDDFQ